MIIVDTETTGINHLKSSIVSIGAVEFFNPNNQFYQECRIFDGAEVTEEALQVNGFTREQITDPSKKSLEEITHMFFSWVHSCANFTFAGENPTFDRNFLNAAAERYGISLGLGHRSIDLHTLAYSHHLKRKLVPPSRNGRTDLNTDKILVYVGLPEEPKPHHALTGAKMEAEAFSRLIHRKILFQEFERYPIPDYLLF